VITRLSDLFLLILVSTAASLIGGPSWIRLTRRLGLVDLPGSAPHKTHRLPTPLAGGLLLASSLAVAYVLLRPEASRALAGMLVGAALVVAGGIADDRKALAPAAKLGMQIVAALVLIAAGVQVHITRLPVVDLLVTMVWVIGLTNAFNFVDSMDGLALGLAAVASAFFMLVTIDSAQLELASLSAALLGAVAGTLFYNVSPARLFLGDSGSQLLGYLLAALGIAYIPGQAGLPQGLTWFIPILVLGVPIFDTTLVVVSRVHRRQPVYHAGLDHTYHRLIALGLDPSRSVLGMQLVAMLLALTAFVVMEAPVWLANAVFATLVAVGLVIIVVLEREPSARRERSGTPPPEPNGKPR
jgi:UDP-GlcNAc:undecaprenyl-phosphate/decaprenyl-phosphate GlcNAc-1-phosphate transferase